MPQVGFEPTVQVFERAKTVHALDRAATVTDTTASNLQFGKEYKLAGSSVATPP
jgi:hypothetical protein